MAGDEGDPAKPVGDEGDGPDESEPPAVRAATAEDPARVVVSWSGGKDAAWTCRRLRDREDVAVVELLTTGSAETGRTSMHGVRRDLQERQADALGLPLGYVELPHRPSNDAYEARMAEVTADYAERGVDAIAFADLHLADVRAYREERLAEAPLAGWWPVWGTDTGDLAASFVDAGFAATLVCVTDDLGREFAGRRYDRDLLADLPDGVDPCGEHGEFHTFVHDGPGFAEPVPVEQNGVETREVGDATMHYCDLVLAE